MQQLRTLLSHEPAELTDDCSSGGVLAEGEASNGDNDEQNRADRSNGIEGDSRSAAQRPIIDKRGDAFLTQLPGLSKHGTLALREKNRHSPVSLGKRRVFQLYNRLPFSPSQRLVNNDHSLVLG